MRATAHDRWNSGRTGSEPRQPIEAESLARTALHADPKNPRAQLLLARGQERHGDFGSAIPVFEKLHDQVWLCRAALDANQDAGACAQLRQQPGLEAVSAYAAWLLHAAQPQLAEAALRQALDHSSEKSAQIRTISRLRYQLALALRDQHRPLEAEVEFWHALSIQREVLGGTLYIADTLYALGTMKMAQGWSASFQPFLKEARDIREHLLTPTDWRVAQARAAFAACLIAERRFNDVRASDLRQAYETVAQARGVNAPETIQLRTWLGAAN